MKVSITYTHKGWFGVCPVYLGALDQEAPFIDPRHWIFDPLFWLSEVLYALVFKCCGLMSMDFEPAWPLRVTSKLKTPISHVHDW